FEQALLPSHAEQIPPLVPPGAFRSQEQTFMIQRRTLLKTGAAIAVGSPALVGFAQQSVTLKFHTFMAPQSHVYLNMHKAWMDKVTKDSGGRIKFEGYPAM